MKTTTPLLTDAQLEALAKALGATKGGLTGAEIDRLLKATRIKDVEPGITKWRRLVTAFQYRQRNDNSPNAIFKFIQNALDPARYLENQPHYTELLELVNRPLMMLGIQVNKKGELVHTDAAHTIDEVNTRANSIRWILSSQGIHPDVINCCREELLKENYFHAVLEAAKSICERVRTLSGLTTDGSDLYNEAFSLKNPLVALNSLRTESERNEQNGLKEMMQGVHHMVRNVRAHELKINWADSEQDAIEILQIISFIHKKLDKCVTVPRVTAH
jgi:uncharacterized protein (TIGR02391 family)